jgi:hypothetical protein
VSLPGGFSDLVAGLLAVDRMDTWVLRVSIAVPLVCIAGLLLWHLAAYLARKLPRRPRTVRDSPEPPSSDRPPRLLPRVPAAGDVAAAGDNPERLQQACTTLEDSLAGMYMQLAESWLRRGHPRKAAAAWEKVLRVCPETPQARSAREHLRQIGNEVEDRPS